MKSIFEEKESRDKRIADIYTKGPVLRGKIYCSPWCGGGCTKAAHDSCVTKAKTLAKRMGKGWKIRVHENLGWHWGVFKGPSIDHHSGILEITPPHCNGDTYTAWIQSSPQFIVLHKDPKVALRQAVALFDKHLNNLHRLRNLVDDQIDQ
jgi:hypothetical protein